MDQAVADLESLYGERDAWWTYESDAGTVVGLINRWNLTPDPADPLKKPKKRIRPVSLVDGKWRFRGMTTPRPLYARRSLVGASRVLICEGEKACDAAIACGFTATTSPHGSESAYQADWSSITAPEVIFLPDNDAAGEDFVRDVRQILAAGGHVQSVRVIRIAGLPPSGDIADFLAMRGGDVHAVRAEIDSMIEHTPPEPPVLAPDSQDEFKPFPTHLLPAALRNFICETASAMGCDEAFVAVPALAAVAGTIGNAFRISLKESWSEPAVIWAFTVGDSGAMKSPPFRAAMQPLRDLQDAAFDQHRLDMVVHENQQAKHNVAFGQWQREVRSDKSISDPPLAPVPPIATRYVVSDTTVEAIVSVLAENPWGLTLQRDEASGWIRSFDQYRSRSGGSDVAHWLSMHGAESIYTDRRTGNNRVQHVRRAAVSITGTIQPGTLRRVLTDEHFENGLGARILPAMPPDRIRMWTKKVPDPAAVAAYRNLFKALLECRVLQQGDSHPQPRIVTLSPEAEVIWEQFYNRHGQEMSMLPADLRAAWSKLEGYAARFALLHHVVRLQSGDPTLLAPFEIDVESIQAGIALSEWFGNEAKRVYAVLREDDDERECRELCDLVQRRGGEITARDLMRTGRYSSSSAAESALEGLAKGGFGDWHLPPPGSNGGRPSKAFRLRASARHDKTPCGASESGVLSVTGDVDAEMSPDGTILTVLERGEDEGVVPAPAIATIDWALEAMQAIEAVEDAQSRLALQIEFELSVGLSELQRNLPTPMAKKHALDEVMHLIANQCDAMDSIADCAVASAGDAD